MCKQDVAQGGEIEPKVNVFKKNYALNSGGVVKKLMYLKRITVGDLGARPPAAGGYGDVWKIFCNFFEKKQRF